MLQDVLLKIMVKPLWRRPLIDYLRGQYPLALLPERGNTTYRDLATRIQWELSS
jgi:hypothetical protein